MTGEIYLTIDTEDDYFITPHMLTGEGLGEEFGAYGILDILERTACARPGSSTSTKPIATRTPA